MKISNKSRENAAKEGDLSFFDLAVILLANLPQRSQEIVKKRFGLLSGRAETLEKIGNDYDITRERVRQIASDAIKKIANLSDADYFRKAEEKIILEISDKNGIITDEELVGKLGFKKIKEASAIRFFAACSQKIIEVEEKGLIKKSWIVSEDTIANVNEIAVIAKEVLELSANPLTDAEISRQISLKKKDFSSLQILNYLDVLAEISKNKFGKWGRTDWMEINPKGTRERIYLVLKERKTPLHFTDIAKLIDESGISKRKSHPQTVHNELIKDDRFVLIGRGIYALREWGYAPGAIKDVLEEILKKAGQPMAKEEIMQEVAKVRQVKKTTIMINLNNSANFKKQNNKYFLNK